MHTTSLKGKLNEGRETMHDGLGLAVVIYEMQRTIFSSIYLSTSTNQAQLYPSKSSI